MDEGGRGDAEEKKGSKSKRLDDVEGGRLLFSGLGSVKIHVNDLNVVHS